MSQPIVLIVFDKENTGPIALYEFMTKKGFSCKFLYYLDDGGANRLALKKLISQYNPLLVGLSFASHSIHVAFPLSEMLMRQFPRIPVICGGVHPTIDPLGCLPYCNAVCIGEGEYALMEIADRIAQGKDYHDSKNLVYARDGKIVRNPLLPLITDLDNLPIRRPFTPDHFLVANGEAVHIDRKRYYELLPYSRVRYSQTFSRGCPNTCAYCCNSNFKEIYPGWSEVRMPSPAATIQEIDAIMKFNSRIARISIADDCFLVNSIEWLAEFARMYQQVVRKGLNFGASPEYVSSEKLEVLRGIDVRYISLGLQSGSKRINKLYRRCFRPEVFLSACHSIRSMGIGLVVHVILDNPWEDENDVRCTLDILTQIKKPFYIMQYSLKIYPGTLLYKECQKKKLVMPFYNLCYKNYNTIRTTDINRLVILAQFLPKDIILFLFEQRDARLMKVLIRFFYFLAFCIMPFHLLRLGGSTRFRDNFLIGVSHVSLAKRWVTNLQSSK